MQLHEGNQSESALSALFHSDRLSQLQGHVNMLTKQIEDEKTHVLFNFDNTNKFKKTLDNKDAFKKMLLDGAQKEDKPSYNQILSELIHEDQAKANAKNFQQPEENVQII